MGYQTDGTRQGQGGEYGMVALDAASGDFSPSDVSAAVLPPMETTGGNPDRIDCDLLVLRHDVATTVTIVANAIVGLAFIVGGSNGTCVQASAQNPLYVAPLTTDQGRPTFAGTDGYVVQSRIPGIVPDAVPYTLTPVANESPQARAQLLAYTTFQEVDIGPIWGTQTVLLEFLLAVAITVVADGAAVNVNIVRIQNTAGVTIDAQWNPTVLSAPLTDAYDATAGLDPKDAVVAVTPISASVRRNRLRSTSYMVSVARKFQCDDDTSSASLPPPTCNSFFGNCRWPKDEDDDDAPGGSPGVGAAANKIFTSRIVARHGSETSAP